jgi:GTP-binding protein
LVDTGGLDRESSDDPIDKLFLEHTWAFLKQVDYALFVLDAGIGLLDSDKNIIAKVKSLCPNMGFIWNKSDTDDEHIFERESAMYKDSPCFYTSIHNGSSFEPLTDFLKTLGENGEESDSQTEILRSFGLFGRPNAGKSSLVNTLLKRKASLVSDIPGTTRDFIRHDMEFNGQKLCLVDTAGIIPHAQKHPNMLERMTYYRTLIALKTVSTAVFVLDASEGITTQDLKILNFIAKYRRGLILTINKWDLLDSSQQTTFKERLAYECRAFSYAPVLYVSATRRLNIKGLMNEVLDVMNAFTISATTSQLNKILETLIEHHLPPLIGKHRIKPRYAHVSDQAPLGILIHGNQLDKIPQHYHRYLINGFTKALKLKGIPIKIEYKCTLNPYAPSE